MPARTVYASCHAVVAPLCFRWKPYAEMERSLRTHRLHTPGEPTSPRSLRLPGVPGRRGRRITVATVATAGMLLAPGLTTSAGAAVTSAGRAAVSHVARPADTTPVTGCYPGEANSYEFYTLCQGTAPAGYRAIAYCENTGTAVLGVEYEVGSGSLSYADCAGTDSNDSTLNPVGWGMIYCSSYNGSGTFAGYKDIQGDISQILLNWGTQNITTGGNLLCDYSAGEATTISTTTAI